MTTCLITGATGFLGSHLVDACLARGYAVNALVRAGSDATALDRPGVTVVRGDLAEPASVPAAVEGCDVVFHCAAKVGDWGPIEDYRRVNVGGTRALLDACRGKSLKRFVYFSSLGVYEARDHHGTDEATPLPARHIDGYTQSKVESEQLVLARHREDGIPVVVLRPGFIYGPRDRTVLPRLVENLKKGIVRWLGSGKQALNSIYVGNLVQAALLALDSPDAVGRIYNLTDGERVSKRRFIEGIADGLGIAKPTASVPMWLARWLAWSLESAARAVGATQPPRITQARLKFLGLNLDFSIERAKRELGYAPKTSFDAALAETLRWYRENVKT